MRLCRLNYISLYTILMLTFVLLPSSVVAYPVTYTCVFETYSDENGLHKAENFRLIFIRDDQKDTTYMLGNNGSVEVAYFRASGSVNIIEQTSVGNIMVTTITDKNFAVHSRNSVLLGDLIASQYYGSCELR